VIRHVRGRTQRAVIRRGPQARVQRARIRSFALRERIRSKYIHKVELRDDREWGKVTSEAAQLRLGAGHGRDNLRVLLYRRLAGMTPFLNMSNQI
jgi:hypothetical protein